jgi:hypothetical protein
MPPGGRPLPAGGPLCDHDRMQAARLLVGVALFAVPLAPSQANAEGGLTFLDHRPVVIPLDDAEVGQRWAVQVLDLPGGDRDVTLHVVFEPAGVVTADAAPVSDDDGIVEFVIELEHLIEGSGELVAVADRAIARRPISTEFRQPGAASTVGGLQFSGARIAPLTGLVRIPPIEIPTGADVPSASTPPPVRVGLLTSERGDVAEVVRDGSEFAVHGVRTVGEFTGLVDLTPDRAGGEVEATVRVRDVAAWPLVVLLAGLAVAHSLDRYQRRQRPQKLHERWLATLREQAGAASRQTGGRLRITGRGTGSPDGLLLDQLIGDARATFHPHMSDAERSAWEPGGAEYGRLTGIITRFRQLCQSFGGLDNLRAEVTGWIEHDDRDRARQALDRSVVGAALRDRSIRSGVDLDEAERPLPEARRYLDDFASVYRAAVEFRRHQDPAARAAAEQVLVQLFRAPPNLAPVEEAADELADRWRQRLAKAPAGYPLPPTSPVGGPWTGPPPAASVPPGSPPHRGGPQPEGRGLGRGVRAAIVATVLAAVGFVAVSLLAAPGWDVGVAPDPDATGTSTPPPTTPAMPTPTIPNAPVVALGSASVPPVLEGTTPTGGQLAWFGVLAPLLIAAAVAALVWLAVRRQRARPSVRIDTLTTDAIDEQVRREDLRFSLIAGILVVLSGMSLLYVGNPTFGTAGDYLALALWGAAVGEGLQLARRFWPSMPKI